MLEMQHRASFIIGTRSTTESYLTLISTQKKATTKICVCVQTWMYECTMVFMCGSEDNLNAFVPYHFIMKGPRIELRFRLSIRLSLNIRLSSMHFYPLNHLSNCLAFIEHSILVSHGNKTYIRNEYLHRCLT